jgi:hypothetical protein
MTMASSAPALPADPLVAQVRARGGVGACGAGWAVRKAYQRAAAAGQLTVWAADQLAIRLLGRY